MRSPALGGKLISSLPRWKRMSVDVIPIETPHTLIVDGSETHFMSGRDFRIDAVAGSMIGKGGWEKLFQIISHCALVNDE